MRSAKRISRTPREHIDAERLERRRVLAELLEHLERARGEGAEWYEWVVCGQPVLTPQAYARLSGAASSSSRRRRR